MALRVSYYTPFCAFILLYFILLRYIVSSYINPQPPPFFFHIGRASPPNINPKILILLQLDNNKHLRIKQPQGVAGP